MSAALPSDEYPLRVFDVVVSGVRNPTPRLRRVTFTGTALQRFGVPGPRQDVRIRMLLPVPGYDLDPIGGPEGQLQEGWYQDWLRGELPGRGWIRTYTVRALRTVAGGQELDVDFVIHSAPEGSTAPGSDWAQAATVGTRVSFIGPDSTAISAATPLCDMGIRWNPQGAQQVLLAGDETAVPAISSILETLPAHITGHAFLEVSDPRDFLDIGTGSGVRITWLARNPEGSLGDGSSDGGLLCHAVKAALGGQDVFSSPEGASSEEGAAAIYAWVGAEASVVKILRRYLVNEVGLNPKQSEFRAYWSLGKAGSGSTGIPISQSRPILA
ncbi:siderophore-interacting protein [Arthrobacter sp. ISL-30]|uniref:siderophore-interacting protein n=1 Tax=Arthrobacter sp. ISL-30 TaxID=2819109 RepID=UPI001BE9B2A5|nr:siderophore-interacting protein [Arthrobacter sp. ISL-30]MBT2514163.1 siderophore-interacting protein [Arthrobacter sp. ISL-30]